MSIATEISRLQGAKADIKTAIEGKGVSVPSSALLDTYPDYIDAIQQGGVDNPVAGDNDVIFIDFDGTIRYSYSAADFANLTDLPANPSHTGLTAQGWNWTLADAKTYVSAYKSIVIGQMYVTDDGKTRLYIDIPISSRLTLPLFFQQTAANGVTIDWGDGTAAETLSGTGGIEATHTYSTYGSYIISLHVTAGKLQLGKGAFNTCVLGAVTNETRVILNYLKRVEMGASAGLSNYAFFGCRSLKSITMTSDLSPAGFTLFQECSALTSVIFPPSVTSLSGNIFNACQALRVVSFPYLFGGSIGNNNFYNNLALARVSIPANVYGLNGFWGCLALPYIVIPISVTSISNNTFYGCYGLKDVFVYPQTPPTAASNIFYNCPSDMVIHVPNGKLATYQSATGWSAYASQMVEMS